MPSSSVSKEDSESSFFEGKRPWSRIKDRILELYMTPYLRKVATLGKPIVLVDCFAGPGKFKDGSEGSPLIMCTRAEENVPGKYMALFVNKEKNHHTTLVETLSAYIEKKVAFPILGSARELLRALKDMVDEGTLFVYLDPFGLQGCEFDLIRPLLERGTSQSTEIVINVSMPTLHRFAARHAVEEGRSDDSQIKWRHESLTKVLGGEYWKEIMFDSKLTASEREEKVMEGYRKLLQSYLPFSGSCPVQARRLSRIKYYVTFCSRHPDALLLMNDIMLSAYHGYMHRLELEEEIPLFAEAFPSWRDEHYSTVRGELKAITYDSICKCPGRIRTTIWGLILRSHFMRFGSWEFRKVVDELVEEGKIESPTARKTKRLNDYCILVPKRSN